MEIDPTASSVDLGVVTATLYNRATSTIGTNTDAAGGGFSYVFPYMNKTWRIQSTIAPSADVIVRMFMTTAEFTALQTAASCPTCTSADLLISKYSGDNENCDPTDNAAGGSWDLYHQPKFQGAMDTAMGQAIAGYSGTAGTSDNTGNLFAAVAGGYSMEFTTSSFSEVRVHMSSGIPLPVEFIYFNAMRHNDLQAKLEWATATEINNDRFEIYRSIDGSNFEYLTSVEGNGNSSEVIEYSIVDASAGMNGNQYAFYRIKQIDYDGKFEWTATKRVDFKSSGMNVSLVPNPFTDYLALSIENLDASEANVTITDINGKQVHSEIISLDGNNGTFIINSKGLRNGAYFVSVEVDGIVEHYKMIKAN